MLPACARQYSNTDLRAAFYSPAPHIIPQGGEIGDGSDKPSYRAGIGVQSDSEILASVHHLPGSDDGNPSPLPGYSRIHFVFAQ